MNTAPAADLTQVHTWLTTLHGGSDGLISIFETEKNQHRAFPTDAAGLDNATAYVGSLDRMGRPSIYARCTTLRERPQRGRGLADVSAAFPGFWADIDIDGPGHAHKVCPVGCSEPKPHRHAFLPLPPNPDEAKRIIVEAGLPEPTLIIHSGGGLYPWWMLDKPHLISDDLSDIAMLSERWQYVLKAGAERLGYEYGTGVGDLARILRIPGTVNRKVEGQHRLCELIESTGATYGLDELGLMLFSIDLPDIVPAEAAAPPPRQRPASFRSGQVGPFDALDEVCEWRDLFEPYGLIYVGSERDGAQLWVRPGATSKYSVRAWPHVAVNHSESLDLPVGAGHRLTHGKVFAYWYHGGTDSGALSRAAKDLYAAAAGDPSASGAARALPPQILDHIRQRCDVRPWTPPPPPIDAPFPNDEHAPDEDPWSGSNEASAPDVETADDRHAQLAVDVRQIMAEAAEHLVLSGVFPDRDTLAGLPWAAPGTGGSAAAGLPPFPLHVLPGDVGKFAEAVATYMQVPVDLPAFAILGTLAALVGGHATITGKWTEHALNLFLACIADSGEGKSPAVKMIVEPLRELERDLQTQYDAQYKDMAEAYEIAVKTRDRLIGKIADSAGAKRTSLMAELDSIKNEIRDNTPPPKPEFLAGDITPEVLGKIMHRTGGHIAIIASEGGFLGNLIGRYSNGVPNVELTLTAFDSSEPYQLERITREPFKVERPSLTISLAVQPIVIADAVASPAVSDRGLLNRFLLAAPESLAGRRDKDPPTIPPHLAAAWRGTAKRAFYGVLPSGRPFNDKGELIGPVPMQISEQAEAVHLEWRRRLERRVDPDSGDLAHIKGWAKKLEGLAYRLAALLHLAAGHGAREVVDVPAMLDALTMADWAIPHAIAVLGDGAARDKKAKSVGPVQEAAEHVLAWIRRRGVEEFTVDSARAGLRGRSWVKEHGTRGVQAALVLLAAQGWVASVRRQGSDGRQLTAAAFVPHPELLGRVW